MTTFEGSLPGEPTTKEADDPDVGVRARSASPDSAATTDSTWWGRLDRLVARLGDRMNPILVKETRQALKSRQFLITFTLVLACAWAWSMLGVAWIGPMVRYYPSGSSMFFGYFCVLAFPLALIVPFGAFRSLAGEREDGTFELLAITTLKPYQIILGKLGSAALQLIVYLSAVAPCLAFTYILRGIDLPTIGFVLAYTILGSLGLAMIGLLLATATQEKHWQVVLSVFLILGLGWTFIMSVVGTGALMSEGSLPIYEEQFWAVIGVLVTIYIGYFALALVASAAQLTFSSDNRSTMLRVVMFAQQAMFIGWMGWFWNEFREFYVFFPALILSGIHWYVMGIFMVGESNELSQRVKRQLPQTFMGRTLFTWFNPGPATGYMFAVANLAGAIFVCAIGYIVALAVFPAGGGPFGGGLTWEDSLFNLAGLGFCYVVIYLGLGRLLVGLLRKRLNIGLMVGVLLQVLLLLAGCLIPLTLHWMSDARDSYSLLELPNPIWSLAVATFEPRLAGDFADIAVMRLVLPVVALVVFLLNLPGVVAEVRHVRIGKPRRVAEEDQALAALHAPPPVAPINPLD